MSKTPVKKDAQTQTQTPVKEKKSSIEIENIEHSGDRAHAGWLVVNVANNRYQFWRTKQCAMNEARKLKKDHGGHWKVSPTADLGPWIKPGNESLF